MSARHGSRLRESARRRGRRSSGLRCEDDGSIPGCELRPAGLREDDEGSVLLLVVGLSVVLLLLVAAVVDVSAAILAKRSISSAVDGAAVAAAQQPDADAIRRDGLSGQLPLDDATVADVVGRYEAQEQPDQPGLVLVSRVEQPGTAVVEGRRTVRLPFSGWLGVGQVEIVAVARARSPIVP